MDGSKDAMQGSLLGPSYTNEQIEKCLHEKGAPYVRVNDEVLLVRLAEELSVGKSRGMVSRQDGIWPARIGCSEYSWRCA